MKARKPRLALLFSLSALVLGFACVRAPFREPAQEFSAAALDTSYTLLGVHPDCSEQKFTFTDLLAIAMSNDVKNQQDFLSRIPKDAAQTFTLVYESESAQAPGISEAFPGVIRMTQDGKLVFRYTCDRSTNVYDRIEIMRFDEDDSKFKFSEIRFNPPEHVNRYTESPRKCFGCHNQRSEVADPRPNWSMYPEWPGVFGSHDDFFPEGTEAEASLVHHADGWLAPNRSKEKKIFDQFIQSRVNSKSQEDPDPCYATLPWPRRDADLPAKYANYPYDVTNGHARSRIYALRPNLKFTEILSHRLGIKNARRLQAAPEYLDVRNLLAAEAARCLDVDYSGAKISTGDFHRSLHEILPGYRAPAEKEAKPVLLRGEIFTHFDPRHPSSLAQGVYGVSIALGFAPGDWTLNFGEESNAAFETGAGPGRNRDFQGDLPLSAYVQHEILAQAARENPELSGLFTRSQGESEDFGPQFSCIDQIAGSTVFTSDEAHAKACGFLVKKALAYQKEFKSKPVTRHPPPNSRDIPMQLPRPFRKGQDNLKDWIRKLEEQD